MTDKEKSRMNEIVGLLLAYRYQWITYDGETVKKLKKEYDELLNKTIQST